MIKILFIIFCIVIQINAYDLGSKYIKLSVNPQSGTLGTGLQLDKPGLVYDDAEYLNKIGIPFEFFSLKVGSKVYANDNAEGYEDRRLKGTWPLKGLRYNNKNIPTIVRKDGNIITAVTTLPNVFRITHIYQIGNNRNLLNKSQKKTNQEKNIAIEVKIENLSDQSVKMQYTRGIDMDPPDFKTDNSMGYQKNGKMIVPKSNIIYTVSAQHPGKYPLSIFSEDAISHRGAILAFNKFKGCLYDPDDIVKKSLNSYSGDGVIYIIFDLEEISPLKEKSFTLSYYLDDDINKLIKKIDTENPKVLISPKVLIYTLKHHDGGSKASDKESFKLQITNKNFIDEGKRDIQVELADGFSLPKGIALVFGTNTDTLSQGEKSLQLSLQYSFGDPIPVWVQYDKNWKAKSEKIIKLKVGSSVKEEGRYKILTLSLKPLKDDSIIIEGEDHLNYSIPYGESKSYEDIGQNTFTLKSKASKDTARHAKILVDPKKIPIGLHLKVNSANLGEDFIYRFGKAITLSLERNVEYVDEEGTAVTLTIVDTTTGQKIPLEVSLKPLSRELEIAIVPENSLVRLDELEESNDTVVTLFANGKRIEGDSFSAYQLKADCGSLNCTLQKDEENHQFLLKVSPAFIMALTPTGETPITLTLEEGFFPNDKAKKEFIYNVEDIGWKKWIDPLINLLLLLLLLWYLWGITGGKKKFKKKQVVTHAPIHRGKIDNDAERDYMMRAYVPWWDTFIPYRAQRTQIEDLRFIAIQNRRIYLAKRSQIDVQYNSLEIMDPGMKDMKLNPGDTLKTYQAQYTIL